MQGKQNRPNRCVMNHAEQAIEDAMTICKWVTDNTVADDNGVDDDDKSTYSGQPPSNGQSSNSNA